MATEALKTTQLTNLDSTPPVRTTNYGQNMQVLYGSLTATTAMTSGSTYRMIRLPSNAILHSAKVWLDATVTTFTGDITLYYGSGTLVGTLVAADIFKNAYAMAAIVAPTEFFLGGLGGLGADLGDPLWQIAGLSSDPGGFFDITIVTTATTDGAPVVNMQVFAGVN